MKPIIERVNEYARKKDLLPFPNRLHPFSPYLNLYSWPRELRFKDMMNDDETIDGSIKLIGIDHMIRGTRLPFKQPEFILPDKLQKMSGKLIYFSLGTLGCVINGVMPRLIDILSRSKHRFIVSKGPIEIKLADNMYGEPFLPQLSILPLVDMVITHGGNNTVTESLYFGKKMLVLPCFGDQFDNAQRITELGLGCRADLHQSTADEILEKIEKILKDDKMSERVEKISKRLRQSNDRKRVVDYIEQMMVNLP
ncbi:UDP-glucuronosyltransferase 2A1 [Dermatophagoides farinae]|uniref:UDP-glucuronosyltransferase 2A1 n=1 Tax=Dermatophagoides farinae TaxID=6954 RepID=A0A922IF01_DERFA|nr:hypothetical protein HUG17_9419 [Dermatophagoides farinae]KAH9530254.1 UDP-glucuronosyltransferase 2A1 [Dermatophagoides farinae]